MHFISPSSIVCVFQAQACNRGDLSGSQPGAGARDQDEGHGGGVDGTGTGDKGVHMFRKSMSRSIPNTCQEPKKSLSFYLRNLCP